jgi:uncharacterized delta-60 repeat protein/uncharacterized repeat protein (TIGR01451 family)
MEHVDSIIFNLFLQGAPLMKKEVLDKEKSSITSKRLLLAFSLGWALTFGLVTVMRADGPGDLDSTFGVGGTLTTDFGGSASGQAVAIQSDGKIVAVGGADGNFAIARYEYDGSLDSTLGVGGTLTTDFGGFDYGHAVAIQSDGKIVAVGGTDGDFALARYEGDGSLDSTFGVGGTVITDLGDNEWGSAVAIQSDGKIVAVGGADGDFALARYEYDGSLDSTFGVSGTVTTDFGGFDYGQAVAIQSDGKIVAVGGTDGDFALARYEDDGSLDSTFGINGIMTTYSGGPDGGNAIAIQSDGRIVVAGDAGGDFGVVRYNDEGDLDSTFGIGGVVKTDFGASDGANAIGIQTDGKIVVAGTIDYLYSTDSDMGVVRYNTDGNLDSTFGISGMVTTDFGGSDTGRAVAIQSDGKIVVVGNAGGDFGVARYLKGPELVMTKTVQLSSELGWPAPGTPLTYTIRVENNGDSSARSVVVTDTLPNHVDGTALSQTVDISSGTGVTFELAAAVANDAPSEIVITNTAYFSHTSGRGQASAIFIVIPIEKIYLPIVLKNDQKGL